MSRWLTRIALAALACLVVAEAALKGCLTYAAAPVDRVIVTSPDSSLRIGLHTVDARLHYEIHRDRTPIVESSRAGILVDGVDLGDAVSMGAVDDYRVGDRANGARVTVTHLASGLRYGVELRAYRDGAAFRMIVPGSETRAPGAASSFKLPNGSVVLSEKRTALPMKAKLPGDAGFVAIMESAPGLPASVAGTITTPWRIVVAVPALDGLANSDIERDLAGGGAGGEVVSRFLPS
jgi:hypothetical protein